MRIDKPKRKRRFIGCIDDAVRALGYESNAHAVIDDFGSTRAIDESIGRR